MGSHDLRCRATSGAERAAGLDEAAPTGCRGHAGPLLELTLIMARFD